MSLPLVLAAGGAALVGYSMLSGKKFVLGNHGPMTVQSVGDGQYLRPDAAEAFKALVEAAGREGVAIRAGSGFRSVLEQGVLYAQYLARAMRAPRVAKPGTSNHGEGTAMDMADAAGRSLTYASPAYRWLMANGPLFRFSWAEGGAIDEPWHWVYG